MLVAPMHVLLRKYVRKYYRSAYVVILFSLAMHSHALLCEYFESSKYVNFDSIFLRNHIFLFPRK